MSRPGNLASWQQSGLNWMMDDDEDQDSDTDSKLSGSAIVDSVMKQLRSHGHRKHFEFSDSLNHQLREQDEEEEEERGRDHPSGHHYRGGMSTHPHTSHFSNGYRDGSHTSPGRTRRGIPPHQSPGRTRRDHSSTSALPNSGGTSKNFYSGDRNTRKEILSPVPEMSYSGARVVDISFGPPMSPSSVLSSTVTSQGGGPRGFGVGGRQWPSMGASGARSMDAIHHTPPLHRREAPPYRPPPLDGITSRSHEAISQVPASSSNSPPTLNGSGSDVNTSALSRPRLGSHGSATSSPHGGMGGHPSQFHSSGGPSPSHLQQAHSHSTMGSAASPSHSVSQYSSHSRATPPMGRTPPSRRANYERTDMLRDTSHHSNLHGHGDSRYTDTPHSNVSSDHPLNAPRPEPMSSREPDLNDVVDFLSSGDVALVANAASYLQHLAYGDDSMKAKIRHFGAIPALLTQLRNPDTKVLTAVLGALRNLSFGRANDENKMMIVREQGLPELMLALKMSRIEEVQEGITSVVWNLSSCEELKLTIVKVCVADLVDHVLIPYSGWNRDVARDPRANPTLVQWNTQLRNTSGIMRNVSSAGEAARVFMRQVKGLVDSLLWLCKAAVQQRQADEKTVENVMCVLRNLSFQLESEVDPQDGAEDVLDREWEAEQRTELVEQSGRPHRRAATPGCLALCTRPRTSEPFPHHSTHTPTHRPLVSRPSITVDFANPDPSVLPKRTRPVQGMALLWQPEVVFPYLATLELYSGCADTLEAAAGAIQNITACSWKWAVYSRNLIRTCSGLRVIAELLNNGHDAVVRAGATALRNLATDPRNNLKTSLGTLAIPAVIPRLPFGSNHLGISESTTVALLVLLMEMCSGSGDNAKLFKDREGIPYITRLSRSRQHTIKIVFAANKICSILHSYKECKPSLKREGWELSNFVRMQREHGGQFDFQVGGASRELASGRVKKGGKEEGVQEKEKKKKKEKEKKEKKGRGGEGRGGGTEETTGVRLQEIPNEPTPSHDPQPHPPSPVQEPGYQLVSTPHPDPPVQPAGNIYQTIDEVGSGKKKSKAAVQNSAVGGTEEGGEGGMEGEGEGGRPGGEEREEGEGREEKEDTRGSQVTSPSSGVVSQDEINTATYAAVEQIKERKRSSRREKERQQKLEHTPDHAPALPEEPSDSWV